MLTLMMSLISKLSFLNNLHGIACSVVDKHVTITSTDQRSFIERITNPKWETIESAEIDSITLINFNIQADDKDFGGSRWALQWFEDTYPDKLFTKNSMVFHEETNDDHTSTLVKCRERCYHGLRFECGGKVYLYNG